MGHNALALYFSPTQEILQQLEYVEVYRNLVVWLPRFLQMFEIFFFKFLEVTCRSLFLLEIDATVVYRHYIRNVISVLGKLEQV